MEGHQEKLTACAVSPDGSFAVSGSADRSMWLWDLQTGKPVKSFEGHKLAVTAVAVTGHVFSGDNDCMRRLG